MSVDALSAATAVGCVADVGWPREASQSAYSILVGAKFIPRSEVTSDSTSRLLRSALRRRLVAFDGDW